MLLVLALAPSIFAVTLSEVEEDFSGALFFEDEYLIEEILDQGLDLNAWDENLEETAFLFAIRENAEPFLLEFLIEQGAELENKEGPPALIYAAKWNRDANITELLLDLGVDVNAVDEEGYTALMYAARYDYKLDIVKALITAGADLEARDDEWGTVALAIAARYNAKPNIIEALVQAGADLNALDFEGWTPLMHAVWFNDDNLEIIELLIDLGADPKIVSKTRLTAYDLGEENGLDGMIMQLLK